MLTIAPLQLPPSSPFMYLLKATFPLDSPNILACNLQKEWKDVYITHLFRFHQSYILCIFEGVAVWGNPAGLTRLSNVDDAQ